MANQVQIDSAGTGHWHAGKAPDRRAQLAAKERGYDLSSLKARQVTVEDFSDFDMVLAMDEDNVANLLKVCPDQHKEKVKLFLTYGQGEFGYEVPDPYYGGQKGFEMVLDLIEEASDGLIRELESQR